MRRAVNGFTALAVLGVGAPIVLRRACVIGVLIGTAGVPPNVAAQVATWRLSPEPELVIGNEADEHTEFLGIGTLLRRADGRILVENVGTLEIRVFDSAGRFERTLGRAGSGPGEFRLLGWIVSAGDTIIAIDGVLSRITRFAIDGRLIETLSIEIRDTAGDLRVAGQFDDGRWLVRGAFRPRLEGPQRVYVDTTAVGVLEPGARGPVRWLGRFPSVSWFVFNPLGSARGIAVGIAPFGHRLAEVVVGKEVWIGYTGSPDVAVFDSRGRAKGTIRLPVVPKPLRKDEVESAKRVKVAEVGRTAGPVIEAMFSEEALPAVRPLYAGIQPGTDGTVWVADFSADPGAAVNYQVVARDGRLVAQVEGRSGFRVRDIGPDYVLGVSTDADGVERVELYGLRKR